MRTYVGVDWSATEVACSTAFADEPLRRIFGANRSLESVEELMGRVQRRDPDAKELHVIIEAGAPGWQELFHHAGGIVHVADPKQAKSFAASRCSSGAKDDGRDGDNLVEMGRSPLHCPKVWTPDSELHTQLRELATFHESLTKSAGATQQRLRALLRERFPTLEGELGDLKRRWVSVLLEAVPTPWHARGLTEARFHELMRGSRARATTRRRVFAAIQRGQAPWMTEGEAQVLALRVTMLVEQLDLFVRQLDEVEAQLDQLTAGLIVRDQLESVGGIGMKMAVRLLELAFEELPADRDQAARLLGASPVFIGSGKTRSGKPKGKVIMRRAVNHRAKATAYLLGRLASQQLDWAGAMYGDARQRGQTASTAYRRIARSLLRILTAMVRTGEPYDNERYVAALQAKGVRWAMELDKAA